MKTITGVHDAPPAHWVGDGFNVRSLFSYDDAHDLSPFILLDHAAPKEFAPTTAQLWVNLPAKDKLSEPGYQTILSTDIPVVALANDGGSVRVIAGEFGGAS